MSTTVKVSVPTWLVADLRTILEAAANEGRIDEFAPDHEFVDFAFRGADCRGISRRWNVIIYFASRRRTTQQAAVTTDVDILRRLVSPRYDIQYGGMYYRRDHDPHRERG